MDAVDRPSRSVAEPSCAPRLYRLIYHSEGVGEPDLIGESLGQIVGAAARRNNALGVTGALFACEGRFLQLLEGSKEAILRVYGAISCDPRHRNLVVLELRPIKRRQFQDWALCGGHFALRDKSLLREPALRDGFRPESLSAAAALGLLTIVRELQGGGARMVGAAADPVRREPALAAAAGS
jgi:hypothetical protein